MLEFENTNTHQIGTIDEFTVARIERLWEGWLCNSPPGKRCKHQFHRAIVQREPGLGRIKLATVYVLLARHDAQLAQPLTPA